MNEHGVYQSAHEDLRTYTYKAIVLIANIKKPMHVTFSKFSGTCKCYRPYVI